MITNKYERTYRSTKNALEATADFDTFLNIIADKEWHSVAEIRKAMYPNDGEYKNNGHQIQCHAAHVSQMLRHLSDGGYVEQREINGTPIEIETSEYLIPNIPRYIEVTTDEGERIIVKNPRWNGMGGKWTVVKKTVTPKIRQYRFIG